MLPNGAVVKVVKQNRVANVHEPFLNIYIMPSPSDYGNTRGKVTEQELLSKGAPAPCCFCSHNPLVNFTAHQHRQNPIIP